MSGVYTVENLDGKYLRFYKNGEPLARFDGYTYMRFDGSTTQIWGCGYGGSIYKSMQEEEQKDFTECMKLAEPYRASLQSNNSAPQELDLSAGTLNTLPVIDFYVTE